MKNPKFCFSHFIHASRESRWRKVWLSPLYLLSLFYAGIVILRVKFYSWGLFRSRALPCKVISVGNLTTGGTGKTPFVCLLATWVKTMGFRSAVLSRGYGGNYSGPLSVVTDGEKILQGAREAGDEPYLLAEKMGKGIPLIVGPDRFRSGEHAIDRFQSEVLILDDGYQHLALKRDLNLLLLNSSAPFGNGYLLPRGILREPLCQLSRADAIILTKSSMSDSIYKLRDLLKKKKLDVPIFQVDYEPGDIRVLGGNQALPATFLQGKRVMAFSGIAQPESFRHTLCQMKAEIISMEVFADHHWYSAEEWRELLAKAERIGATGLVTTEKDGVRLKGFQPGRLPVWLISVKHSFQGEDQVRFEKILLSRLGRSDG